MLPSELLLLCALVPGSAALPATALFHSYRSLDTRREQQRPLTADVRSSALEQYRCFHEDELERALSPDQWLSFDELWRINQLHCLIVDELVEADEECVAGELSRRWIGVGEAIDVRLLRGAGQVGTEKFGEELVVDLHPHLRRYVE